MFKKVAFVNNSKLSKSFWIIIGQTLYLFVIIIIIIIIINGNVLMFFLLLFFF